jgi:chorismate mutase/prephenate dehydratase
MSDDRQVVRPLDLSHLREGIEELDRELLALLRRRMEVSEKVAQAKIDAASPFRDRPREDQVLQRVRHVAADMGLDPRSIERLYRFIMDMSVERQQAYLAGLEDQPLRVAYQGVEGSNSHLAAQRRYAGRPGGVLLTGCETLRQAADAVHTGEADLGFLPIENSTAGSINETYDLLAEDRLFITAEEIRRIDHALLVIPGTKLDELRAVLSHPQALAQCDQFLRSLPHVQPRPEFDTAGSARQLAEVGDRTWAAIASEEAGRLYGLEVLKSSIQNQVSNYTRFVEVAREGVPVPPDVPVKTSLLMVVSDEPGSLGQVLVELARRGLNVKKLESRPIPEQAWRYRFYVDVEGHAASEPLASGLKAISGLTSDLRVLGSYPAA